MNRSSSSRLTVLLWWLAINGPFVLGHPGWTSMPGPFLRSMALNLVLFIAPGLAICGWRMLKKNRLPLVLPVVMLGSFAVFLGLLVLFQAMDRPITAAGMWNGTWIVSNLFAAVHLAASLLRKPWNFEADSPASDLSQDDPDSRAVVHRSLMAVLLLIAAYGLYFDGAVRIVPPQPDHDLEVQGTGFGLVHRLEPLLLTDRGPHYYFAHPLLLHFYAGGSFLYFEKIEQLRPYDEASKRVQSVRDGRAIPPPAFQWEEYRIVAVLGRDYLLKAPGSPPVRAPIEQVELEWIDSHFAVHPGLLETRTPSIFLAALTVAMLGWWAAELGGGWGIGLLTALGYMTSPEVYVRSSYGGYFAISNFLVLMMLLALADWDLQKSRGAWWSCILVGLLAGLANHKLALLPVSFAMVAGFRWLRSRETWSGAVHPLLWGFVFGTAAFWGHGFLIDAEAFWKEHVRTHLVDRAIHLNPLGYSGYPTVSGLWAEFSEHTGYALLPLGLLAVLFGTLPRREDAKLPLPPVTFRSWAVWMAVTALVFSLVDWRMTKHLSPLLIPLFLAPAAWSASRRWTRGVVAVVFLGLVGFNLWVLRDLMVDFGSFTITPAW